MKINSISTGNSQSFGLNCSTKLKEKILDNKTSDYVPAFFYNNGNLVSDIDKIGSDAVTLSKYKIKRHIIDLYDETLAIDKCYMTFKMKTPNGKAKKVNATIESQSYEAVDIYDDFKKVEDMAEKKFVKEYLKIMANKGKLHETAKGLENLYPAQKEIISECESNEEYQMRNYIAQKSFLNKLKLMLRISK